MSSKSMVLGYWDIRGVSGPSPAQPLGQRGAGGPGGERDPWADLRPAYRVPGSWVEEKTGRSRE